MSHILQPYHKYQLLYNFEFDAYFHQFCFEFAMFCLFSRSWLPSIYLFITGTNKLSAILKVLIKKTLLLEFDSAVGPTNIVLQASYTKKDVILTVSNITQFKHLVLY
ncbi:hypothetical protein MGS_02229, partial [Candida albicans P78042]